MGWGRGWDSKSKLNEFYFQRRRYLARPYIYALICLCFFGNPKRYKMNTFLIRTGFRRSHEKPSSPALRSLDSVSCWLLLVRPFLPGAERWEAIGETPTRNSEYILQIASAEKAGIVEFPLAINKNGFMSDCWLVSLDSFNAILLSWQDEALPMMIRSFFSPPASLSFIYALWFDSHYFRHSNLWCRLFFSPFLAVSRVISCFLFILRQTLLYYVFIYSYLMTVTF